MTVPPAFVPDLSDTEDSIHVALGSDLFCCGLDGGSSWFYWNRSRCGRRRQNPFLYLRHLVRSVFVGTRRAETLAQILVSDFVNNWRHQNAKRNPDLTGAGGARDPGPGLPGYWLHQAQ